MASYDPYDAPARERTTKRYYREERRDDRDPRYFESRETHVHVQPSRDLVPRPREDSDLSVEEIRRDFPPPGYSARDIRRARSAEGGYYDDYDDRRSHHGRDRDYDDYGRKSHRKPEVAYYEEEQLKKQRMLSKQEQIIAAVTGAALAIGGKELYDRRSASQHGTDVHRNLLTSAALGAAGAFAGYQGTEFYNKRKEKHEEKALGYRSGYYSDDDGDSVKEKKGHKNFLESALAAAGLGGAVKALTGGHARDDKSEVRSRRGSRDRDHSRSRSTSRSRGKDRERGGKSEAASKVQKAAMASLIAGATEAFRISKQPGSWKGEKAKRILTAAAGAATLDAAQNTEKAGSKLGLAEAVVGGLVGNRFINGSKKNIEMDERTGRSRSRSRAGSRGGGGAGVSGLAALATAGLGAFGAKKLIDDHERSRSRRRSADSRDSRDGSPDRRRRSRSRSIVDATRRRLAKVGIGNGPDDDDDRDRRDRSRDRRRDQDDYDDHGRSRRNRDDYDDYDRDHSRDRRRGDHGDDRSNRGGGGHDRSRRGSVSSSDLGDSDEDKKRDKKMRGKQIITTGLAAVATIHAAHSVYQSVEKRHARKKAVREGQMSHEEAEKLKKKALLQDAAAVGIAALGIKGAISEVKEAREMRHELREWREEKEMRHKKRLERQKRLAGDGGNGGNNQSGGRRADSAPPGANRYNDGPRYVDGNPYGARR